ncbi:MAG: PGPGW domain-containing protein [Actinomycetota bacterium]
MSQFKAIMWFVGRSTKRVVVTIVGAVLLVAGLVMIVTPGPGMLLVVAGLAVLGTEYLWARRFLARAKQQTAKIVRRARSARSVG